jgi:hypothetical protein
MSRKKYPRPFIPYKKAEAAFTQLPLTSFARTNPTHGDNYYRMGCKNIPSFLSNESGSLSLGPT